MFFWDLVKKSRRRSRRVKAVKRLNSNVIAAREFIDIFRDQESPRSAIINHHHSSVYTLMQLQEYTTYSSMTSLFAHKVAQPNKWRYLHKNFSQLVIFVIGLASLGYEATKIGPNFRK